MYLGWIYYRALGSELTRTIWLHTSLYHKLLWRYIQSYFRDIYVFRICVTTFFLTALINHRPLKFFDGADWFLADIQTWTIQLLKVFEKGDFAFWQVSNRAELPLTTRRNSLAKQNEKVYVWFVLQHVDGKRAWRRRMANTRVTKDGESASYARHQVWLWWWKRNWERY